MTTERILTGRRVRHCFRFPLLALLLATGLAGCGFDARWPTGPAERRTLDGDTLLAWQLDRAERPNYFQRLHDGRITTLYYDTNGDGRFDETVDRTHDSADWPHCILILDGTAFEVVKDMWQAGHFRLFPPPSRVISVFPAMTDLALTRLLHTPVCPGPEALYFDKQANRMVGGSFAYLRGDNAPWLRAVSYHAPQDIGAKAYLSPQDVFDEEMRGTLEAFRKAGRGTVTAYSIGSAGLGTRGGREAMKRYLCAVEQLCERIVYERHGRVRITLTADHGHNLKPLKRVKFEETLARHGYQRGAALNGPRDVVIPAYGLVTYAALYTKYPADLAPLLLDDPAIELSAYADGDRVIVLSREGRAEIRKGRDGYTYTRVSGDPLKLARTLEWMKCRGMIWPDGSLDDLGFLQATAEHHFPDSLHRLWECFHGLMEKPPDIVVSLFDQYCHGSGLFELGIGQAASTHGALDLGSSSSFVLSDVGELPDVIRIDDLLKKIEDARRRSIAATTQPAYRTIRTKPPKSSHPPPPTTESIEASMARNSLQLAPGR